MKILILLKNIIFLQAAETEFVLTFLTNLFDHEPENDYDSLIMPANRSISMINSLFGTRTTNKRNIL